MIKEILSAFIGLSEGIIVGTALVAFITLLDIVPRLAQLTGTENSIKLYEKVIVFSTTFIALANVFDLNIVIGKIVLIIVGVLMGLFIGLLAAALTEVTNVIPVLVNKAKLAVYIKYIFFSMISGKIVGSLIYWIFISK